MREAETRLAAAVKGPSLANTLKGSTGHLGIGDASTALPEWLTDANTASTTIPIGVLMAGATLMLEYLKNRPGKDMKAELRFFAAFDL